MDDAFHPTPSRRQAHPSPDPEMVESGSKRGRRVVGDEGRDATRGSGILTRVSYGCMFMTDATRQRDSASRAPQSRARPVAECRSALRCGRTIGPCLLHIAPPSLSVPRTSSAAETAGRSKRSQTGIHRQTSTQPDPASPHVGCGQRIVHQRGGQPSIASAAAARARAWVSRNQFGDGVWSWNIDSIVCCQTSSLMCTSCSCQINVSPSAENLRNQRTQTRE